MPTSLDNARIRKNHVHTGGQALPAGSARKYPRPTGK